MIPRGPLSPNMSQGVEGVTETPIVLKGLIPQYLLYLFFTFTITLMLHSYITILFHTLKMYIRFSVFIG